MSSLDVEIFVAPKGHYEIVVRGIDHVWGALYIIFCKDNAVLINDSRANNLSLIVKKFLEST